MRIVLDLLTVLKYLHNDCRFIHRDLNPSNVMLTFDFKVKLTDFGLSLALSDGGSIETQENVKVGGRDRGFEGTLAYSSPETVETRETNEKADVWAFGCILYELITLRPAFSNPNPLVLAKMIAAGEYEPIVPLPHKQSNQQVGSVSQNGLSRAWSSMGLGGTILEKLARITNKCLIVDHSQRPTALELLSELVPELVDYTAFLKLQK